MSFPRKGLRIKRLHILLALLVLAVCAFLLRDRLIRPVATLVRLSKGVYSVKQRLAQYSPIVRERLAEDFRRADCPYPPAGLLLVGFKKEKRLEVWVKPEAGKGYALLKIYPIQGLCGGPGPKLAEGDGQVPEGIYRIDWLNPNSHYHLSMRIDYPNEYDKARAVEDGRENLGGEIMIHGGSASAGCLAMGDEVAEDLFVLVAETGLANVEVILCPVDFRVRGLPEGVRQTTPHWIEELYEKIKLQLLNISTGDVESQPTAQPPVAIDKTPPNLIPVAVTQDETPDNVAEDEPSEEKNKARIFWLYALIPLCLLAVLWLMHKKRKRDSP